MNQLSWDQKSYILNGERKFLVSGEVHYFRVPKEDWEERLFLLKEAGGNCVATYIPWILHEPVEGDIRFGDIPQRDLKSFLELCRELDLMVICRPGPYQYSELKYDGLPGWLCENYPEILARNIQGKIFRGSSVSYLHPLFLEKAKKWFDVVCPILSEYMVSKDGPIIMVQIDNELMGIHEWFGGWDYNPETMGFGIENGRYPSFLQKRYLDVDRLNLSYGSSYARFEEVFPINNEGEHEEEAKRKAKDYQDFYFSTIAEYVSTLYSWLRGSGIDCQIIHNSANPNMDSYFLETVKELGKELLLGSDHYYNLNQDWNQNNPTPQYAINVFYSHEMLRLMGYPSTIFEIPGGSFSDWPPVLPEDLMCCYMANTALGMKGVNYYIFTGGPNPEGVSHFGNIYDYGAPVGAFGEIRPTYETTKQYGEFLEKNSWLAGADRLSDFYIGLDWEQSRSKYYFNGKSNCGYTNAEAWEFLRKGLMTTAFCGSYSANLLDLYQSNRCEDLSKPLFITTSACMSEAIQKTLVQFVEKGGKLFLAPVIPRMDENFNRCTLLSDYLGAGESKLFERTSPVITVGDVDNIFVSGSLWSNSIRPIDSQQIAFEIGSNEEIGWKKEFVGGGKVIWLGFQWRHTKFEHTEMLRYLLEELGCDKPLIRSSNPNVWTSLRSNGKNHMLFVMNLLSSTLCTEIEVKLKNSEYQKIDALELRPMEVKVFDLLEDIAL
jgi:beta-galactosidase